MSDERHKAQRRRFCIVRPVHGPKQTGGRLWVPREPLSIAVACSGSPPMQIQPEPISVNEIHLEAVLVAHHHLGPASRATQWPWTKPGCVFGFLELLDQPFWSPAVCRPILQTAFYYSSETLAIFIRFCIPVTRTICGVCKVGVFRKYFVSHQCPDRHSYAVNVCPCRSFARSVRIVRFPQPYSQTQLFWCTEHRSGLVLLKCNRIAWIGPMGMSTRAEITQLQYWP